MKRRMLRIVSTAIRDISVRTNIVNLTNPLIFKQFSAAQCIQQRFFGAFSSTINNWNNVGTVQQKAILSQTQLNNIVPSTSTPTLVPVRTVTKFSKNKGKRKTVKAVIRRFFRLNWGIWIRTRAGRKRRWWKKSRAGRRRAKQHVFCNATQSTLLDKMVTNYWKRPHYYVDDPYAPYHKREEFYITRKKPQPY